MFRLCLILAAALGSSPIASAVLAGEPLVNPAYLGDRSNNPEHETYAIDESFDNSRPLAFIGPARPFGSVAGDPEKDTVAYRPVPIAPAGMQTSLNADE